MCNLVGYRCKSRGGNGRLWKRCGLPSITLCASPLKTSSETEMRTAPYRRIACMCSCADQWGLYLFAIAFNSMLLVDNGTVPIL